MSTTHLQELERHEQAIEQARALERQREDELRERTRSLTALRAQRLEYERSVGAGGDRDEKLEQDFAAELNDLDLSLNEHGETIDRRAQVRVEGARNEREWAEEKRDAFCRQHADAMVAEVAAGDPERTSEIVERLAELADLMRAKEATHWRVRGVLHRAGRLPDSVLTDPTAFDDLRIALRRALGRGEAALRMLPGPDEDAAA